MRGTVACRVVGARACSKRDGRFFRLGRIDIAARAHDIHAAIVEAAIDARLGGVAQGSSDGGLRAIIRAIQGGGKTVTRFGGDKFGVGRIVFLRIGPQLNLTLLIRAR